MQSHVTQRGRDPQVENHCKLVFRVTGYTSLTQSIDYSMHTTPSIAQQGVLSGTWLLRAQQEASGASGRKAK